MTLIALYAYSVPAIFGSRATAAHAMRICLALSAGVVGAAALTALFLWRIGSLGGFVDQTWRYNAERFLIGYWQTPAGLTSPATRIDRVATEAAGLLFVGALVGGLALWAGPAHGRQRLLLIWGVFSLVAVAGFREFAQVVPSLALLAALGTGRLWEAASRDGLGLGRPAAGRLALVALLGSTFVLSSSFQVVEARRALYERGPTGTPSDPEQIAAFLRGAAPPGPVFTWANAGQIYALSGRQPATRFVIAEFTNSTSPRPDQSRSEVMSDLQARPPSVIVIDPHADEPGLEVRGFASLAQVMGVCYHKIDPAVVVPNWSVYVEVPGGGSCVSRTIAALGRT
jgi:hypothetical protein